MKSTTVRAHWRTYPSGVVAGVREHVRVYRARRK